jgi:pimeloyl-ACP methyl ester carboxylesterase
VRLRLWHAPDGARVAYRESGTGPPLALLHSLGLSHRELEPVVEHLVHRYRVILPDLPLHGDSEDRPRHPYTLDWFADVMSAFCHEVCGPHPVVGGHGMGAEILLSATIDGRLAPERLILMSNRLHRPPGRSLARAGWRLGARAAAVPGLDRALSHAAHLAIRPEQGIRLSARQNPAARDLVRHAFADVAGNANLARSWAPPAPARLRRGGAGPSAPGPAARPSPHRLPGRVRRPCRSRARDRGVRLTWEHEHDRAERAAVGWRDHQGRRELPDLR